MKKCLKCGQSYSDDTLNFCLNDGEMLVQSTSYQPPPTRLADDSPPTLVMNQPRVTNPIDWAQSSTPAPWHGHSPAVGQQYGMAAYGGPRDQTFATLSLILGIASFVLVCCFAGIWLGLPAAIVGFIALRNADAHPDRYTGRGLAIGGMVLGIISFFGSLFFLIFGQLS